MKKLIISNTAIVNYITDGVDGVSYETIYKSLATYNPDLAAPASVDEDNAVPDGWSRNPTGVTQNLPYEYCCKRSKNNGVWGQWSPPKVSARWSQDGTSLNIKGNAITIEIGDPVDVKSVYEEDPTTTEKGDAILISAIHESDGHYIMYRVEEYWDDEREAYSHFIVEQVAEGEGYIINAKESVPTDYDGHVFVATEYHDDLGNLYYWQDLGYLKGVDGDNGEDAVYYEFVPDVNVINANADGTITTGEILLHAYKVVGAERSSDVLYYFSENNGEHAQFAIDNGSWTECSTRGIPRRQVSETYIPAASVQTATTRIRLRLLDGNNAVCGVCPDITIVRNGEKGDQGRMFYLAGTYPSGGATYYRTDKVCPIVYYEPDANTKEYWYLDAANNQDGGGNNIAPSDTAGNPWKKADKFGITITEALFAAFAKLGSFIVYGDYFFSQYGKLIYNDGGTITTTTINGSNYNTLIGGQLPYTYFDASDPEGGTNPSSGNRKFVPSLYINAKTGRFAGNDMVANGGTFNNINAVGGTFEDVDVNGIVHAKLVYSPHKMVGRMDGTLQYTIDPDTDKCKTYIALFNRVEFTLPDPLEYEGLELQFFTNYPDTTFGNSGTIVFLSQGQRSIIQCFDTACYRNYGVKRHTLVYTYEARHGVFITLKSMQGWWYIIEGDYDANNMP